MNKDGGREIDQYFKKVLEDPVGNERGMEEDWAALEMMLDSKKKRSGLIFWLPVIAGIAAMLFIIFGWFELNLPETTTVKHKINLIGNNTNKEHTGTSGGSIRQHTKQSQMNAQTSELSGKNYSDKTGGTNKSFLPLSANSSRREFTGINNIRKKANKSLSPGVSNSNQNSLGVEDVEKENKNNNEIAESGQNNNSEYLIAHNGNLLFDFYSFTERPVTLFEIYNPASTRYKTELRDEIMKSNSSRPNLAITLLAAPDINGVGSFQQGKVGTNFGALLTFGPFKRFSISSGAIYSVKPYGINVADYHTSYKFSQNPSSITAQCKMLDIPLNIDYLLYHKSANNFSIGTGLSSYLMMNENYTFAYANSYYSSTTTTTFNVPHSHQYYFGVLNLNATYQRQLSTKFGFIVQPYLKLPLTNLGYGQVRLQTTGVAVGLTWNINPLTKP